MVLQRGNETDYTDFKPIRKGVLIVKRFSVCLMAFVLAICFFGTNNSYALIASGSQSHASSGHYVHWEISDDGTITFSNGNAVTLIYMNGDALYWGNYKDRITKIVVQPGILFVRDCYSCPNLTSVSLADTVTYLDADAFRDCPKLVNINIPDSMTLIRCTAFYGCVGLSSLELPDSVTEMEHSVFAECSNLRHVRLPAHLTTIENNMFYNCTSLQDINIPNSVKTIKKWAFSNCSSLTELTLPEGITQIEESAFLQCSSLTELSIPASLSRIERTAFANCFSLKSVTLTPGTTEIEEGAFGGCNQLTDVYYSGTEAQWKKTQIGAHNKSLTNAKIHFNTPVSVGSGENDSSSAMDWDHPEGIISGIRTDAWGKEI